MAMVEVSTRGVDDATLRRLELLARNLGVTTALPPGYGARWYEAGDPAGFARQVQDLGLEALVVRVERVHHPVSRASVVGSVVLAAVVVVMTALFFRERDLLHEEQARRTPFDIDQQRAQVIEVIPEPTMTVEDLGLARKEGGFQMPPGMTLHSCFETKDRIQYVVWLTPSEPPND